MTALQTQIMTELAAGFSIVERGDSVILKGYPDSIESEWHVNTAAQVGAGSNERKAIILQAADAGQHWITVALFREGDDWEIGDFAAFEGEPPQGAGDEAAIPLEPDEIEFVELK